MNLDKISKVAQTFYQTNEKLDIPKVIALAVVTGGIIWGGVAYQKEEITKEEKSDVCAELQAKLDMPGSLSDKVKTLQAKQELGCK